MYIYRDAQIVTMDDERRVLRGDLCFDGARIVSVGGTAPEPNDRSDVTVVDAKELIVLPGIVQSHVHLCQALFRGMADDLALLPWLKERIWPLETAHDPDSLFASAALGAAEMIRAGTTTILDMGTVHHQDSVFEVLRESGLRAFSGLALMDEGHGVPPGMAQTTRGALTESSDLIDRWHGTAGGRLNYALAPRFILSCSEALLRGCAEISADRRVIVHSHASEHEGERKAVLEALGKTDVRALHDYGVSGPRTVLAHGVQLDDDEIAFVADLGTRFVHCPSANMKLASGIAPVHRMRSAGVIVGLGADGAPCNNRMDPWTEIRQAALLGKVRDRNADRIPAMEALSLATIEGAKLLGLDAEIGSLERGKRADVTVVRADALHMTPLIDPVSALVYSATASDVSDVFVNGNALLRNGELQTLDADNVRSNAQKQAKRVMSRAGL